jgi:hypothetical protein
MTLSGHWVGRWIATAQRTPALPHRLGHRVDVAIITPPEARDRALMQKLDPVAGRMLPKGDISGAAT